jgi:hypothetical protein
MKNNQRGFTLIELMVGFVFVCFILMALAMPVISYTTIGYEEITVEEKERVCSSDNECKYLIFTNKGVFENTDSYLQFKFDSSDVYGALKPESTYKVKINGLRIPFLSMYKNILNVEETIAVVE